MLAAPSYDQRVPEYYEDEIPIPYMLEKLHQLANKYFNNVNTAFAELRIEGIDKPFWVHREYLELQSQLFREVFENVSSGDVITICIPSPETFEPLFEYLYDGNADKWYETFTKDNYGGVWQNVEFFGLGPEARDICLAFENENRGE